MEAFITDQTKMFESFIANQNKQLDQLYAKVELLATQNKMLKAQIAQKNLVSLHMIKLDLHMKKYLVSPSYQK